MSKNDGNGVIDVIVAVVYGEDMGSDFTKDHELANKLLGLPEIMLEEVIAKILKG